MAGQSSAMFGWSWTKVSVLFSQILGRALMESCAGPLLHCCPSIPSVGNPNYIRSILQPQHSYKVNIALEHILPETI